jgi:hypothetical protein
MKPGKRLAPKPVWFSRQAVTDGPFAEAKEVVGGFWFITRAVLDEAAQIAAGNPCLAPRPAATRSGRSIRSARAAFVQTTRPEPIAG